MNDAIRLLSAAVPEGRVFGLDSQTLIQVGIQLINGIILTVALTFILYKPVKEFMGKRQERIQNDIDSANQIRAKSDALIEEYEAKIDSIEQERLDIIEAARQKAEDEGQLVVEKAEARVEEIKKRARENVAEDRKRLHEQVRLDVIDISSLIAEQHVAMSMDDEAQKRFFDWALAQLEEAEWVR